MKFGYYILNTYVPEFDGGSREIYSKWLEQIDAAESLGFDSLWVTEHHFRHFGGQMPSPSVILAAASQRTKKMRLGAAVSILPMHNPLRIAEEFAMVDQLSSGRLDFGAGRGMHPTEYAVFGYDWSDAQKRLPEALDIVMRAWSGEEFEWQSENYTIPQAQSLSGAGAATASADLHHGQPRSGKFPSGRFARPSSDDPAVDRHQRRAGSAGENVSRRAARGGPLGRRQRRLHHVSGLCRRQRRAGQSRGGRALAPLARLCSGSDRCLAGNAGLRDRGPRT